MSNSRLEEILKEVEQKEKSSLWCRVMVVWESPITHNLDHREFYFTCYTEAMLKVDELEITYSKLNVTYEVYCYYIEL